MVESVFVIGATGKVGKELVRQILKYDTNPKVHVNPTSIVGLASSESFLYVPEGIQEAQASAFTAKDTKGERYENLFDILDAIRDSRPIISIVDVTASHDMLALHREIIEKTKHKIVTANKNPLTAANFEVFQRLISETQRYGYRCSVMAGAEAVDFVRDHRDLGDSPTEIAGCFSGTLGYISTELEKGRKFSDILEEAVRKGYTEPNPAIDLSGEDVAKKILILVRTAGYNVSMEDIDPVPFINRRYMKSGELDLSESSIQAIDRDLASQMADARAKGHTLRYVARFVLHGKKPEITVKLESVRSDDPLGMLQGTSNKIVIRTRHYGDKLYTVEAPGAGIEITAGNIRRDLLYQIPSRYVTNGE
jgi:homoserine dehydrogenase